MRLLQLDAHGVISLVAQQSSNMPKYAILSHTWGADEEEVTYEDLIKSKDQKHLDYQKKPGYKKLIFCAKEAKRDGYDYFWVDTCTIDKSSSAELTESINSMFQWYQQSGVCYAYLSDVTASKHDPDVESQVMQSRWFCRGWTLQELLAPSVVRFFNQKGEFLGDKDALRELILDTTGINFGAILWPSTLESYSIATRLSWASRRETKRKEDEAYCLLGILGVHMPLLYGEGENAFRRLQEELIKISDDESIFAHSGYNLLARGPHEFAGARQVIVLRKSESAPYSITNAGLHIHMRVLPNASNDPSSVALGILNCHDYIDESSRDRYLALPLHRTTRYNTFRRHDAGLQFVSAKDASGVGYEDIFIQLKRSQVSRLTLLEQYDEAYFTVQLMSASSPIVLLHSSEGRGVRFYPLPPYWKEVVRHRVQAISSGLTFETVTYFDLQNDRTGLEIKPFQEHQEMRTEFDHDSAFVNWAHRGGPVSDEVLDGHLPESREFPPGTKIRASVSDINDMKAFVWALQIEIIKA